MNRAIYWTKERSIILINHFIQNIFLYLIKLEYYIKTANNTLNPKYRKNKFQDIRHEF